MVCLDITYNYLGREETLMGQKLYSGELNVLMSLLMSLNGDLNYNPWFMSCELTQPCFVQNFYGPSKDPTFEEAFQFKIRDDFTRVVADLQNGLYGKNLIIYSGEFQEKIKTVCSSFRFKHTLVDKDKLTFDLCTLGVPLNVLAILDFIIPIDYDPTSRSNEVVYTLTDMIMIICKSNSYGKGVLTKNQCFYY